MVFTHFAGRSCEKSRLRVVESHNPTEQNALDALEGNNSFLTSHRILTVIDRTIFYSLLAIIILIAIPHGGVDSWWASIVGASIFLLAGLSLLKVLVGENWNLPKPSFYMPLFGLAALAVVQIIPLGSHESSPDFPARVDTFSLDPFETRRFLFRLLALILFIALLTIYTSTRNRLNALVNVIIGTAAVSALFGLVERLAEGKAPPIDSLPGEAPMEFAQFVNRNHFALFMEMSLGLGLGIVLSGCLRGVKLYIYGAALLAIWLAVVMSGSRGGLLSIVAEVGTVSILCAVIREKPYSHGLSKRSPRRQLILRSATILLVCTAMTLSIFLVAGESLTSRLENEPLSRELQLQKSDSTIRVRRIDMWAATVNLIKAHPIAGAGLGAYWVAIPHFFNYSGKKELQQAHNDYLELLAGGGLIAGGLLILFVVLFLKAAIKRLRSHDLFRRAACSGALTGLVAVAVHSSMDFGLHVPINTIVFAALIVIASLEPMHKTGDLIVTPHPTT
jgi:O-antigen ligase